MKRRRLAVLFLLVSTNAHSTTTTTNNNNNIIVHSIPDQLPYDENGKLTTHTLVYPANGPIGCRPSSNLYGFQVIGLTGKALQEVFPTEDKMTTTTTTTTTTMVADTDIYTTCRAACLERGTDRSVAHAVLPHKYYDSSRNGEFDQWFAESCSKLEACFINYYDQDHPIQSFWIPPGHHHHHYGSEEESKEEHLVIDYGDANTQCFSSYLGHLFQIEDSQGTLLQQVVMEYSLVLAIGESPPSGDHDTYSTRTPTELEATIAGGLSWEWQKHHWVQRTFSPLGFAKGRLPDAVFASMGAFYYNNRHHKVREEWTGKGLFVNWWETDVFVISIPHLLKQVWQIELLPLVEAWAGVPLEQTAMYGFRQYEPGARLLTHVDRVMTHAVSLIVNVAQGGLSVTEPWPVEILDHADRLHEIYMEPGDIVYYESAKNLHGRNQPLQGGPAGPSNKDNSAYYVNLFTHYRPVGGDESWYLQPNPPGTPEPLLRENVVGNCRVPEVSVTEKTPISRPSLGLVECDDPRLGSFLSPTLFTAQSGDDLLEWWRQTSPAKAQVDDEDEDEDEAQCDQEDYK
jgi:hypothetical protein